MRMLPITIILVLGVASSSAFAQATSNQGAAGQGKTQAQLHLYIEPRLSPAEIHRCTQSTKILNSASGNACTQRRS